MADSDSPQFEQGWTLDVGAALGTPAGRDRTSWVEAAHRASLPDRLPRLARRAIAGDSVASGRAGHWGSPEALTGVWPGVAGGTPTVGGAGAPL